MHPRIATAALLVAALALSGCASSDEDAQDGPELPWESGALPELVIPADNPTTEAKVALGRMLFYDPLLSSDKEVACATCHSEIWGMSDGLEVSVGIDGEGMTGPGREGPNKTRRNSPTLWNVAYRQGLFWDGRSPSLEEQALKPIEAPVEMNRNIGELIEDLRAIDGYRSLFAAAFPGEAQPITQANLARALAALQRTFVSDRAPYDRYASGDAGALSSTAIEGMFLFAEAGCSSCHVPPLFESERYANRGIGDSTVADDGRFEVTGDPADQGAFRVPTLRNLRETEPYFHDGSVQTLPQAVAIEVARSVEEGDTPPLDDQQVHAIAVFLEKGLMDRSQEPDRPEEVPSGLDVPKDGFRFLR